MNAYFRFSVRIMVGSAATLDARAQQKRAFWLKHLHQWHWVSAAACLIGLVLFSLTGFTLNHADDIGATPKVTTRTAVLPETLKTHLEALTAEPQTNPIEMPSAVNDWLESELSITTGDATPEWSAEEVYVSLPRPGGDAWLSIDVLSGEVTYEITHRGWISYLNDLHKGRNTGTTWSWFIDVFAFATLIFAITGLFLLQMHAKHRPATWPMVGFGLVLPLVLALLFIH
jgi:hypothetical protein